MKDDNNRDESTGDESNNGLQMGLASQSRENAMLNISNVYYFVVDSTVDISFTHGFENVRAMIEAEWSDSDGEGICSDGDRACALVRAIEDFNGDVEFHCGCRGEQTHSHYHGQQPFEDILNLTHCILRSEFDDVSDPFR